MHQQMLNWADITRSPAEANVIANSSKSGADSPTTSTDEDGAESAESTTVQLAEDQMGSSLDEGNLLADSADTTVAGNVSIEEIREDVRTGRIDGEPQQVLNDVHVERESRETSEDSHDEL